MPYFVSLNSYQSRKSAVVRISLTTLLSEFYAFRRENITMYRFLAYVYLILHLVGGAKHPILLANTPWVVLIEQKSIALPDLHYMRTSSWEAKKTMVAYYWRKVSESSVKWKMRSADEKFPKVRLSGKCGVRTKSFRKFG